jgi:hypothetical protein
MPTFLMDCMIKQRIAKINHFCEIYGEDIQENIKGF